MLGAQDPKPGYPQRKMLRPYWTVGPSCPSDGRRTDLSVPTARKTSQIASNSGIMYGLVPRTII